MKPEELLDPARFPPELQWVATEYRLQPNDPVFLLIAWHWQQIKKGEDSMRAAALELKSGLDKRVAKVVGAAETVAEVNEALSNVSAALDEMPVTLKSQFESQLTQPITTMLRQIEAVEKSIKPLLKTFEASRHREILVALLIGVTLGIASAFIALLT